jgi:carbamoyltransferase
MYHLKNSPFMTISFPIWKDKLKIIPGVVHIDNSCRIQTVDKSISHLYEVLTEFNKITNVPILLNTSFNVAGMPLTETIEDAIKTFNETSIDIIWFPEINTYIRK